MSWKFAPTTWPKSPKRRASSASRPFSFISPARHWRLILLSDASPRRYWPMRWEKCWRMWRSCSNKRHRSSSKYNFNENENVTYKTLASFTHRRMYVLVCIHYTLKSPTMYLQRERVFYIYAMRCSVSRSRGFVQ